VRLGCNPLRPGGTAMGTLKLPVPVNRSGEKVSPMPAMAPPPLGREMTLAPRADFWSWDTEGKLKVESWKLKEGVRI